MKHYTCIKEKLMRRVIGIFFIALFFSFKLQAQRSVNDSIIATPWISVQYGLNWTAGDLDERFGLLNHLGLFAGWKNRKNWVLGVESCFIFGNDIRINGLYDDLRDSKGNVTDINGDIAKIKTFSRGYYVNVAVGKIIPVLSPNKNSGIYLNAGVGYLAYKLRVETQDNVVPLLELDYRKGYDRLTSGLNTQQFIGYSYMANQGAFNFYGGFYIQEGYTFNRRNIFFDQPETEVPKDMRLDIQYGFKLGWMVPVYKRVPKSYYYN